jgi:AAA-like domain
LLIPIAAKFLGMEDNRANRDMLKNLTEGQCIVEDMYGRTEVMKHAKGDIHLALQGYNCVTRS